MTPLESIRIDVDVVSSFGRRKHCDHAHPMTDRSREHENFGFELNSVCRSWRTNPRSRHSLDRGSQGRGPLIPISKERLWNTPWGTTRRAGDIVRVELTCGELRRAEVWAPTNNRVGKTISLQVIVWRIDRRTQCGIAIGDFRCQGSQAFARRRINIDYTGAVHSRDGVSLGFRRRKIEKLPCPHLVLVELLWSGLLFVSCNRLRNRSRLKAAVTLAVWSHWRECHRRLWWR